MQTYPRMCQDSTTFYFKYYDVFVIIVKVSHTDARIDLLGIFSQIIKFCHQLQFQNETVAVWKCYPYELPYIFYQLNFTVKFMGDASNIYHNS